MNFPDIGLLIIGDEILSSKRQDKHLQQANQLLKQRGITVRWVKMVGDEESYLVKILKESFASNDIVFCFGGIGATPDDRTRQSASKALDLPLKLHPDAKIEIVAQYGEQAFPQRIKMGEYPEGASIIPNQFNRVPGFSIHNHHFMPGFPKMAKTMLEWVLNHHYPYLKAPVLIELSIKLNSSEGEWVEFMKDFEHQFPSLRLYSLPTIAVNNGRNLEIGVEGEPLIATQGYELILKEANKRGLDYTKS